MLVQNELLFNDNLVKIKIVLEVFEHAESKAGLYSGLYLFLKKVSVILCWNWWQFLPTLWGVFETRQVFGRN